MPLPLEMLRQPTDSSCGPTCLHAIYKFYGRDFDLKTLIKEVRQWDDGGTLSVHLACHSLRNGFDTTLYSYNVGIFDPTWRDLPPAAMIDKLRQRTAFLKKRKSIESHRAYIEYLELGGILRFDDLNPALIDSLVSRNLPILTGLSATYLYQSMRERRDCTDDDIAGAPAGHFLVVTGYNAATAKVSITDPFEQNPFNPKGQYQVDVHRFINSVMLGIVTYDANLLTLSPRK